MDHNYIHSVHLTVYPLYGGRQLSSFLKYWTIDPTTTVAKNQPCTVTTDQWEPIYSGVPSRSITLLKLIFELTLKSSPYAILKL